MTLQHLTTDEIALANLRCDALNFSLDLIDLAESLKRIAAGRAERGDVALVRSLVDDAGDLVCRAGLDVETLLASARSATREADGV